MLKCGLITRISRASCTVCIVALLPEPWNASRVGFVVFPDVAPGGGVPGVIYVEFVVWVAIAED